MKSRIYNCSWVHSKKEFPEGVHYAAIVFSTVHYADDGYGQPGSAKTIEYLNFLDKDEMEKWVIDQETSNPYSKKEYQIIESHPKKINLVAKVEFK